MPNSIIVLLFIQNIFLSQNKLKHAYLYRCFFFDSACLSARLGDKGLFSAANILQIADVVRQVAFLLFLLFFLRRETSEMFRHSVFTIKTTQPRPEVFSVNRSIIWPFCCTIDVISSHIAKFFQIWSRVAGYDELCVGF